MTLHDRLHPALAPDTRPEWIRRMAAGRIKPRVLVDATQPPERGAPGVIVDGTQPAVRRGWRTAA